MDLCGPQLQGLRPQLIVFFQIRWAAFMGVTAPKGVLLLPDKNPGYGLACFDIPHRSHTACLWTEGQQLGTQQCRSVAAEEQLVLYPPEPCM